MDLGIPQEIQNLFSSLIFQLLFFFIIILGLIELINYLKERSKRKWLEKHPELADKLIRKEETKKKTFIIPQIVPKKVKVIVLLKERQIETFGKMSVDGLTIKTKNLGTFVIPQDYKPKITLMGRKTFLTFYFDENGNALDVHETGEVKPLSPDPIFNQTLVDKGLVARIFRLGFDLSSLITGIGLGCLILYVMIFFVLPLIGIPITIGKTPIVITTETSTSPLPPAGNYTIP
jgi:hypothetical protein